ncbi:MAG: hypothetical protein LAO19_17770 [Acidobacteriia bacterium]|nr:hypothetical protein [Terriglobia bacterium]
MLESITTGEADPYMPYRRLYLLWYANNAALQELRPLFRMKGIDADSHIIVTNEFREQVRSLAKEILPKFSTP